MILYNYVLFLRQRLIIQTCCAGSICLPEIMTQRVDIKRYRSSNHSLLKSIKKTDDTRESEFTNQNLKHGLPLACDAINHDIAYDTAITALERESDIKMTTYWPYLALTGELWGVFCDDYGDN